MQKILLLNYEFPPLGGGASPVSYEIALRLSEMGGYDIDVVTMGYKDLPKYEEVNKNFRIHRVACLRSRKELCYPWEQATYLVTGYLKAEELVQKQKFDVCHCHFIIPTGIIALQLNKKFGLPYVITSHGSDVPGFNGDRFKILHKFTGPLLRSIIKNSKKIVSPSVYLKSLIHKNVSEFVDSKIQVIPNGIDISKFIPLKKKKYIFSSGRLLARKGFQYLIQAVSDEDIGYEVHIAGDGPMMKELQIMAQKSKTKIILHGWLDNHEKEYIDLLEQSAIYVLMSDSESFGMVLIEAMSAGCSIVVANISGSIETIGDAGILVEPRNYFDLNKILRELITNEQKMKTLQRLALDRVKDFYDWSIILNKYREVLL